MIVTLVSDVLGAENNGTTIAAMNLVRSLRGKGHTVRIVCPDQDKRGEPDFFVVPTVNLGPLNGYVQSNGVLLAKVDEAILREAFRGADIVHIMFPFPLCQRAAKIAKESGLPVTGGFHMMAENFTTHIFMQNFPLANRLTYAYAAKAFRRCDAIHYPTQFLRDLYERMYGYTNGYVISNGVNEFITRQPVQRPAELEGRFLILMTGRFSKEKAQPELIDAIGFSRYRDQIQLILAGSGPREQALKKRGARLPHPPILHFYSREEMRQVLNYCDLYVHAAEIEAEGIACLEAIKCGLVPVISDSPRCATGAYAMDERSLFRHGDPRDLAAKIDWWIEHPAERRAASEEYRRMAEEKFDLGVCMDQMEKMLLRTVEEHKKRGRNR